MQDLTRTFAAIEIGQEEKERIGRFSAELRKRPGGNLLRWVRPEIIHITVRFFGNLDRKRLAKAREAIAGLDGEWDLPELRFGRLGAFPSLRRPQVLWLGIEDDANELTELAAFVDHAIRTAGFGKADKKFIGHLTLGRVGRGRRAPDLQQLTAGLTPPAGPLTIHSITLFKSDLRPEGPVYTPLDIARPRSTPGESGTER